MPLLYISLGSNLGRRHDNIHRAVRLLEERVGEKRAVSEFVETKPAGFQSDHLFVNAAAIFQTNLTAEEILFHTQQIEKEMGRTSKSVGGHYADRPIDIDLLHLEGVQTDTPPLTLPHPRMARRRFVLEPMAQIAPSLFLPSYGKSIATLLQELNTGKIERLSPENLSAAVVESLDRLLRQLSAKRHPISMEYLREIIKDENVRIYVLRDEENVVQATLTLTFARLLTGKKAWVEDVVVDMSCRRRSYARQLLRLAEKEAGALGFTALNLTSRPGRMAANRLYKSEGYEMRETNVYKKETRTHAGTSPIAR